MFVKAKRLPSALNPIHSMTGDCGSVTFLSLPSANHFKREVAIALPAMRRIGARIDAHAGKPDRTAAESSAMVGMLARSSSAMTSRAGLTSAVGGGGASSMSTMTFRRKEVAGCRRLRLPMQCRGGEDERDGGNQSITHNHLQERTDSSRSTTVLRAFYDRAKRAQARLQRGESRGL
jgi:hypothetical protein